jgi:conjugal transfer pilus assembly protein TraD
MSTDAGLLVLFTGGLAIFAFFDFFQTLSIWQRAILVVGVCGIVSLALLLAWEFFSKSARDRRKRVERIREIPSSLIRASDASVFLGVDQELGISTYLPDAIRARHVHILGATGSGKTESVILNMLRQDVSRGLGAIILDAKGDASFLRELEAWVPEQRRKVFDLSSEKSLPYDPLAAGGPMEGAQRLFSSLLWSEEYYKSKAFSALQRLFELHHQKFNRNPNLADIHHYLETEENYTSTLESEFYPAKLAARDFLELSGLRDQVRGLTVGYLGRILSPGDEPQIHFDDAWKGSVLYFRLQSLLSQQLVSTVGKLIINHLGYLAGTAHRQENQAPGFLPTYLDEFASFACPEFADLISKARSAGLALHFSHQSIGDLAEVSPGFLSRITDNSATKIVMRINDPDSAEQMARTFGTSIYQKVTQRISNADDLDATELVGEGSQREAHQFRAAPDLLKTLPTGMGSVLIAHGEETPHGASTVFRVRFPRLTTEKAPKTKGP